MERLLHTCGFPYLQLPAYAETPAKYEMEVVPLSHQTYDITPLRLCEDDVSLLSRADGVGLERGTA